jgi:hypothetical protein
MGLFQDLVFDSVHQPLCFCTNIMHLWLLFYLFVCLFVCFTILWYSLKSGMVILLYRIVLGIQFCFVFSM